VEGGREEREGGREEREGGREEREGGREANIYEKSLLSFVSSTRGFLFTNSFSPLSPLSSLLSIA
jgi:hypothetical protein